MVGTPASFMYPRFDRTFPPDDGVILPLSWATLTFRNQCSGTLAVQFTHTITMSTSAFGQDKLIPDTLHHRSEQVLTLNFGIVQVSVVDAVLNRHMRLVKACWHGGMQQVRQVRQQQSAARRPCKHQVRPLAQQTAPAMSRHTPAVDAVFQVSTNHDCSDHTAHDYCNYGRYQ